jgi:hypothetical protein
MTTTVNKTTEAMKKQGTILLNKTKEVSVAMAQKMGPKSTPTPLPNSER